MNLRQQQAIETLGDTLAQQAIEVGTEWGTHEAQAWREQDGDRQMPEWTMGTYQGRIPVEDDKRDAYELLLDLAARDAWNAAKENA